MQTILIQNLVEKFDVELVRLGYNAKSLKNYRIFWKQLTTFFQRQQQQYFSEKKAMDFLDERYHLSEVLQTRALSRNETHIRQMVRKLVYFQKHETIGRLNGVAERLVNTKNFLDVLGMYLGYCLRKGYAPSTRMRLREDSVKFFFVSGGTFSSSVFSHNGGNYCPIHQFLEELCISKHRIYPDGPSQFSDLLAYSGISQT
jgi:hypothetical protein